MAATDPAKFTWDAEERVFRDKFNRTVSRKRVRDSLDKFIDQVTLSIRTDTEALVAGNMNIAQWQLNMESNIKRSHTAATAIAKGGWQQAKSADWALAGRQIKEQYKYLDRFARQLENGRPLNGATINRAEMYGLSGTKTYEGILRRDDLLEDFDLEMRVLHSKTPCDQCAYYADLGWVVAGTLPNIGEECECLTRCRCTFERKRSPEARKRRADRKPKKPVVMPKAPVMPQVKPQAPKVQSIPEPVQDAPANPLDAARAAQRKANQASQADPEYARLRERFPDLIPPGPIQERLARYTWGDEKAKAIQGIGKKYADLKVKLEAEREAHNQSLLDDMKKAGKLIDKYVGSSKPIPPKVAAEVDAIQVRIDRTTVLRNEVRDRVTRLRDEERTEAHAVLKVTDRAVFIVDPPDGPDASYSARKLRKPDAEVQAKVDKAVGWMEAHVARGDKSRVEVTLGVSDGGRAFYHSSGGKHSISLSQYGSEKTIVHELGHGIDYQFETGEPTGSFTGKKTVRRISKEFLEYRVGDEQPVNMNALSGGGFRDFEEGRKDKFDTVHDWNGAYYTGHATSVEVFTMGVQEMYADPVKLATKDPEWFKFVAGIMDGSLR